MLSLGAARVAILHVGPRGVAICRKKFTSAEASPRGNVVHFSPDTSVGLRPGRNSSRGGPAGSRFLQKFLQVFGLRQEAKSAISVPGTSVGLSPVAILHVGARRVAISAENFTSLWASPRGNVGHFSPDHSVGLSPVAVLHVGPRRVSISIENFTSLWASPRSNVGHFSPGYFRRAQPSRNSSRGAPSQKLQSLLASPDAHVVKFSPGRFRWVQPCRNSSRGAPRSRTSLTLQSVLAPPDPHVV